MSMVNRFSGQALWNRKLCMKILFPILKSNGCVKKQVSCLPENLITSTLLGEDGRSRFTVLYLGPVPVMNSIWSPSTVMEIIGSGNIHCSAPFRSGNLALIIASSAAATGLYLRSTPWGYVLIAVVPACEVAFHGLSWPFLFSYL